MLKASNECVKANIVDRLSQHVLDSPRTGHVVQLCVVTKVGDASMYRQLLFAEFAELVSDVMIFF